MPNFGEAKVAVVGSTKGPVASKQVQLKLNQLVEGAEGSQVKTLQILLIQKYGISCGKAGADGVFGSGTKAAVITFQRQKGLAADGICGMDTWTALLVG